MFKGVKFLFSICYKFSKKFLIYQFLSGIIIAIVPIVTIIMPKFIIDELLGLGRIHIIISLILILVSVNFLGNIIADYFKTQAFINKNIAFKKMQLLLTENLFEADYESIESASFLDLKEKAYKFLYGNGKGFASIFEDFSNSLTSLLQFLGIITIISTLNIWITILLILLVVISGYVDAKYSKKIYDIDMQKAPVERRIMYYMSLTDDFVYGKDIRIYNMKKWIINKYSNVLDQAHVFYKKSFNKLFSNNCLKQFFAFIEQSSMYLYLSYSVLNKSIGLGDFTMYVSAINSFATSMKVLMNNIVTIRQYENYYNELEKFLNMPKKLRIGANKLKKENNYSITFENVYFKYKGQSTYALENISFIISAGEKISIVGENGAGKTTLIKLLLKLYEPTKGNIYINNTNIRNIQYEEYMTIFSVVFQDFKLFADTIKENILLGKNMDLPQINEAIQKSGLSDKISKLPNGLETNLFKIFDDEGVELSGGQAQKLSIARGILKNAPIFILDEPNSALDPRAEYELFNNFNDISEEKTVLYISHRLSSCKFCDKILVLQQGQILEYGHHSELIKENNLYSDLFNMQAQNYI